MKPKKEDPPKLQPGIESVSYRVKRVSTFGWQAMQITVFTNGVIKEEPFLKEDVLEITLRKIGNKMKDEAHTAFLLEKAKSE